MLNLLNLSNLTCTQMDIMARINIMKARRVYQLPLSSSVPRGCGEVSGGVGLSVTDV